jgi:hypothetical protein
MKPRRETSRMLLGRKFNADVRSSRAWDRAHAHRSYSEFSTLASQLALALHGEGVNAQIQPAASAPGDSTVVIAASDKNTAVEVILKKLDDWRLSRGLSSGPVTMLSA